jgi:hypothetical protein
MAVTLCANGNSVIGGIDAKTGELVSVKRDCKVR